MKRILISILILMVSTSLVAASVADPVVVEGPIGSETEECELAGCEGTSYYKFQGWSGVIDGNTSSDGVITIHDPNMTSFNWSSTKPVCAVIVKSGTKYNIYKYGNCTDGNPQCSDTQLETPFEDISHVTFCYCSDQQCNGQEIPEFPAIAVPIAAILGLAFFFQRRRN